MVDNWSASASQVLSCGECGEVGFLGKGICGVQLDCRIWDG